jgi:DNA-binding CsgD family transcriptional regulator/tetratricopeptide (TPR) repeat protein
MLETVREYALERLEAEGERESARDAHAAFFTAVAARYSPHHGGVGQDAGTHLWGIEDEQPNLRTAFSRLAEVGDGDAVLRLAGALAAFWQQRAHHQEGRRWLEWGLAHTTERPTPARSRALAGLGLLLYAQGFHKQAIEPARAGLRIAEQVGDEDLLAFSLYAVGHVEAGLRHWVSARSALERALAGWRSLGEPLEEAATLLLLSGVAYRLGRASLSTTRAEAALALFRAAGDDPGAAAALCNLARLAHARGDDRGAARAFQEALWRWSRAGDRWLIARALAGLGELAIGIGRPEDAATLTGVVDGLVAVVGSPIAELDRHPYDRRTAAARVALGERRYADLRAEGRRLVLEQAIALAEDVAASVIAAPGAAVLPDPEVDIAPDALSPRERQVLRLLAEGHSDAEIAAALYISPHTVHTHVKRILAKLGVSSRAAAVATAFRHGMV